nr:serine/threonine-protein kinase LMTK1 [Anser cygnoides]
MPEGRNPPGVLPPCPTPLRLAATSAGEGPWGNGGVTKGVRVPWGHGCPRCSPRASPSCGQRVLVPCCRCRVGKLRHGKVARTAPPARGWGTELGGGLGCLPQREGKEQGGQGRAAAWAGPRRAGPRCCPPGCRCGALRGAPGSPLPHTSAPLAPRPLPPGRGERRRRQHPSGARWLAERPQALDEHGTPLSELSWSSSLAVVAISFSGLFTFIFLMLACLCCKKGDIGFKEFENAEGDDYVTEFSAQGSPAPQHGPEVYILPLTEVSLPMAKQPGRSVQLLKSADLGRQSLLYLKEIGHGWFGKVFLGEVNSGISSTQVVVKELKASASVQDQMQFLEEAQPYRALQHTNLLQCLAQCAEVTPYLLVMEFCPLGDLKGYLRSCRGADTMAPDPLTLQRMACEVACGVLHLHRNNYIHSDLALRNCLLTADLTVKIGDYGLSHCKYKVRLVWVSRGQRSAGGGGSGTCCVHTQLCTHTHTAPTLPCHARAAPCPCPLLGQRVGASPETTTPEPVCGAQRPRTELSVLARPQAAQAPWHEQGFAPTKCPVPLPGLDVPLGSCKGWGWEAEGERWGEAGGLPGAQDGETAGAGGQGGGRKQGVASLEEWHGRQPAPAGISRTRRGASFVGLLDGGGIWGAEGGVPVRPACRRARRSLGVTIWELFELGSQPYDHYSDRQVLAYAIKEQQLKLPKPQLKLSLSERWYEVMQFCWLQPEQRPTAEEVHLLLSYLCAKGATEAEEEFEKRWNSMKPNSSASGSHHGAELSSFPLLEQFSADGFPSDGDDILTVMETSHGLNFEYKWEHTKTEHFQAPLGSLSPSSAARYHDLYYPAASAGRLSLGVSPSCYECKQPGCPGLPAPGVVPILGAHSPSLGSEYYIRIEGPAEGGAELDYAMCSYSPEGERGSPRPPSCWRPQGTRGGSTYDSDSSPTVSLSMEPLLGHAPAGEGSWECAEYYPYACPGQEQRGYEPSPGHGAERYLLEDEHTEPGGKDWPVPGFQHSIFGDPLGVSPSVNCAYSPRGYGQPPGQSATRPDCVALELGDDSPPGAPLPEGGSPPAPQQPWASNSSSNNNIGGSSSPAAREPGDSWCYRRMITFRGLMAKPLGTVPRGQPQLGGSPPGLDFRRPRQDQALSTAGGSSPCRSPSPRSQAWQSRDSSASGRSQAAALAGGPGTPRGPGAAPAAVAGAQPCPQDARPAEGMEGSSPARSPVLGLGEAAPMAGTSAPNPGPPTEPGVDGAQPTPEAVEAPVPGEATADSGTCPASDTDRTPDKTFSSASFPGGDDGSDEDTAELTSGVFTDFSGDYMERVDMAPAFKSLQKQVGTPDSLESLDIPSTASSCEVFSPTAFAPAGQPKALDSGYDTENNESPEFVLKEPHEPREPEAFGQLGKPPPGLPGGEGDGPAPETRLSASFSAELHGLSEKNPYRDSAYFSDYDTEAERGPKDDEDSDGSETPEAEKEGSQPHAQDLGQAPGLGEDPLHPPGAPGSSPAAPSTAEASEAPDMGVSAGDWSGAEAGDAPAGPTAQEAGTDPRVTGTGPGTDGDTPGVCGVPPGSVPPKTFFLSPVPASPEEPASGRGTPVAEGIPRLGGDAAGGKQTVSPTPGLGEAGLSPEGTGVGIAPGGDAPGGPSTLLSGAESPVRSPPGLSLLPSAREPRLATSERREEPEEEEEDTEDSDESDEELRCYNIQEQSEESEEEPAAVPIVVAESHSSRNLRSLLKMPSLLSEAFCEDLERKKKAVSFYDDVTIYLFDQESPTRELGEQSFPDAPEPSGQPPASGSPTSPTSPASPTDRLSASDDSSDGNASEESGGFEWDDDFPLMPAKPSLMSSLSGTPAEPDPSVPALLPAPKQVLPIQFSRFTVSPAPVSRFSITHVSDSDMDSIGGSSEDGDRE